MASALTRAAEIQPKVATGNAARLALGQSLTDLGQAYSRVNDYNPLGLPTTSITSDEVTESSTSYLDTVRSRAEIDFAALPATDESLPDAQAHQVAFDIASIESASGTINNILSTTALDDLEQTVRELPADLAAGIGNAIPAWLYLLLALVTVAVVAGLYGKAKS